ILYVPANIYPILRMYYYGAYTENTIWDGCIRLFQDDQYLVAVIVFLASIVIPFFKLVGLFYLTITAKLGSAARRRQRTWIFKFIDTIGPWRCSTFFSSRYSSPSSDCSSWPACTRVRACCRSPASSCSRFSPRQASIPSCS